MFEECKEYELTENELYFSYCCRVNFDLQAAVVSFVEYSSY